LLFLSINLSGQKKRTDLIDVILIKNNGDTVFVQSKESYYNEHSFNSFGYYNKDGSRGRIHADEYRKIIINNKYFESVCLKSTVRKECKKKVFLERIVDGPMIMYVFHYVKQMIYTSKCIDEVYIRKANENCAFPIYKELCPHELLTIVTQPKNREDMIRLFSDVPELVEKIESGYYLRSDYYVLVQKYNEIVSRR